MYPLTGKDTNAKSGLIGMIVDALRDAQMKAHAALTSSGNILRSIIRQLPKMLLTTGRMFLLQQRAKAVCHYFLLTMIWLIIIALWWILVFRVQMKQTLKCV